nr:nucleotidyltransferase [Streptomyces sp. 846.5]
MTPEQRISKLNRWTSPPSEAEAARLERAKRMVIQAVQRHPRFDGVGLTVEAKGSWANNTNVSSDSDMDIKVEFTRRVFTGALATGMSFWELYMQNQKYGGQWTAEEFRSELGIALKGASGNVDASHNVAFLVPSVPGSRPDTDVVPCFTYTHGSNQGTVVFTKDGKHIINWSHQQLVNGRAKNVRTNRRYKYAVRALKAVENDLVAARAIKDLPSYFMECLVYNVPDQALLAPSFDQAFQGVLAHLRGNFDRWWGSTDAMTEPNEIKKLFGSTQKWQVNDGRQLVAAAWDYLGYRD